MNIVYLCLQPLSGQGASDAHVAGIVDGLRETGQEVELIATTLGAGSLRRRLLNALIVQTRSLRRMWRADAAYIRMHPVAAFTTLLVRRTVTVIEVNGVPEDFYVAHPSLRRISAILEALLRYQLRRADHVVVVTSGLAEWVASFEPRSRSVHVVPNAADPRVFEPPKPRPPDVPVQYALFFGALTPWQGLDLALAAASHPDWPDLIELVIIGAGQEEDRVEEAQEAMPNRVRYLGSRPREQLPAYVANAVVTLLPKRYHTTAAGQSPLKLYESLAAGVPVIATPLPGVTDERDFRYAIVTVDPTPSRIAHAVANFAENPREAARYGHLGRLAVLANHTWSHRAARIAELIHPTSNSFDTPRA